MSVLSSSWLKVSNYLSISAFFQSFPFFRSTISQFHSFLISEIFAENYFLLPSGAPSNHFGNISKTIPFWLKWCCCSVGSVVFRFSNSGIPMNKQFSCNFIRNLWEKYGKCIKTISFQTLLLSLDVSLFFWEFFSVNLLGDSCVCYIDYDIVCV